MESIFAPLRLCVFAGIFHPQKVSLPQRRKGAKKLPRSHQQEVLEKDAPVA